MVANPLVDAYIGRSIRWPAEITRLRPILLDCGLTEELKWSKPCYSHAGRNIVIVQEMNDFLALMFFKGALLSDPAGVLEEQGPNSRSARRIRFTSGEQVAGLAGVIRALVHEAIEVEERGLRVAPAGSPVPVDELRHRLDADPTLKAAFESLTPGRQREYTLYFAGAKQPSTRAARVERHVQKILQGRGLRD